MSRAAALMASGPLRAVLDRHLSAGWPDEACALLVEGHDGPSVICTPNIADHMHAIDPETFPRAARTSFLMDPRAFVEVESNGGTVVAIVHSHCEVGAYFSDEDIRMATAPCGTAPWYPGVEHVVVAVQAGCVRGFRVFAWCSVTSVFVETATDLGAEAALVSSLR